MLVLFVVVYYGYENWQGGRAWSKAAAQLTAAGISLDPHDYLPPPVPMEQNFAALPIFQRDPRSPTGEPTALDQALAPLRTGKLPRLGRWDRNEEMDLSLVRTQLAEYCCHASPPIPVSPNASASELLSHIFPVFTELRTAARLRSASQFEIDYPGLDPTALQAIIRQLDLAEAFSYEEQLALLDDQPQRTLDDFQVEQKVLLGFRQTPLLLSGLLAQGIAELNLAIVREGLARHSWNEPQLQRLETDLAALDFLSMSISWTRGDFIVCQIPETERLKSNPRLILRESQKLAHNMGYDLDKETYRRLWETVWLTPSGRYDHALAIRVPFILPGSDELIDFRARRVYPKRVQNYPDKTSEIAVQMLFALEHFIYTQAHLDEARIACRLERYRLVHGVYPFSLDALPAGSTPTPLDIMSGLRYRYRLNPDGTYILYSIGWNQRDDGGENGEARSLDSADWTWSNCPDFKATVVQKKGR